jgi:tRNA A37 N6-isopentenylltransferase MiaA
MTLAEAAQRTKWAIHAYVRRQDLWLKRQPGYRWLDATGDELKEAVGLVDGYLRSGDSLTPVGERSDGL